MHSLPLYRTESLCGDHFHLNRCLNCSAVFLAPRPTPQQLDRAYDDCYYGKGDDKFHRHIEKVLDYFRSVRACRIRRYVRPPARILDIGCGNGQFLAYLIDQGFDAYGTELPGKAAHRAGRIPGLKLRIGPLREADFGQDLFDAVCMWHVFEHLVEPEQTLHEVRRILRPTGCLMMSLPNIHSVQARVFRGHWFHLDPPRHLFFLSPSDLIREMSRLGFHPVKVSYFSLEQNPFGIQQSLLNCLLNHRDVLFEALKANAPYGEHYSARDIALQKAFYLVSFPLFTLLSLVEAACQRGGTMEMVFRKHPA